MAKPLWFVKSKRAQTSDDDETWLQGGVVPTLNAFDMGDTRATVVIVMREREGKAGGGKGFLLSDISFTLSSSNFHILFMTQIYPIDDGREVEKNQNGTGIGNEGDPAYTLDRLQSPAVAIAVDIYNCND
jgi:hypothetical protein